MNISFLLSTDSDFDVLPSTNVTFSNPTLGDTLSVYIIGLIDNTVEDREAFSISIESVTADVPINVNFGINTAEFEIINIDGKRNNNQDKIQGLVIIMNLQEHIFIHSS